MNRTTADRPTLLPTAGCAVFDSGRNPFLSPSAATDEGGTLARDYVRPANRPADAFATTSRHAPTRERHSSHLSENDCFACAASAASAQHHEDSQQVMSESQRYNWDTDFDSDDDDPATEPPVAPSPHANAFDFDDLSHEELASCDIAEQESIRRQAAQAKKEERERHEGIYLTQAGLSVRDTSRRVAGEDISAKESLADQILKCSEEQREFLRQVALGNNVFITGSAKTGKSFTVSLAIKTLRMAGHQVAIVAPTGMAAITNTFLQKNTVGDRTINDGAALGVTEYHTNWEDTDVLVIDEVSMVSHKMFDLLDRVAQYARDDSRPFGGIQLIISGDFFQLAPVPNVYCNECGKDENLEPINKKTMICLNEPCVEKLASKDKEPNRVDKRTLYAFQSSAWERCNFTFLELTRIFRQCDAAFSALLNRLRLGCLTVEDIELLNSRVGVTDDDGIVPTRIETHRRAVKEENERMFKEFSATVVTYVCEDGATRGDHYAWSQIKYLNKRVRAEEEVRLKKGTQVMLTANLSVEEGLVNGSRGVVVDFEQSNFPGNHTEYPVAVFIGKDGERIERIIKEHEFKVEFSSTSKMWRKQIPLVFGWAITVHKSQGISLDRAIIDIKRAFCDGQVNVALSRVRSLEGVRFKAGGAYNTLPRVEVNYVVKNFYLSLRARTPVNVRQVVDATLLLAACAHGRLHGSVEDFAAAATRMFLRYREHGAVNQASLDVQIPQNEGVSDVDSESLEDGVVSQSMRIKFETGTEIGTKAEENVSSVFVKMEPGEVSYIPAKKEGQENSLVPVKTEPHDTIGGSSHDVEHGIAAPLAAHVEHEDNVIQGNWDLKRRSRKLSLSTVEKKLKL